MSGGVGPGGPIGPVDPGTTQQATCPPRSGVYNGYCYTVFNGFFNNWWFGYQQCRHLNADMVSFEDQAELDWFKGWFKKNFFDPHGKCDNHGPTHKCLYFIVYVENRDHIFMRFGEV